MPVKPLKIKPIPNKIDNYVAWVFMDELDKADINVPTKEFTKETPLSSLYSLVPPPEYYLPYLEQVFNKATYKGNNTSETLIGIEVEVENIINRANFPSLWHYEVDGSLRNNGTEYISDPIPAKYAASALEFLNNTLKINNTPSYSRRTSIHIHINVQDLTLKQLQTFTLLYLSLETLLYKKAGSNRANSIFCVPLSHAGYIPNLLVLFEKSKILSIKHLLNRWHKYTGYNMMNVTTKGTVEFRHLPGTDDVQYISEWINLLVAIKEAATKDSLDNYFKLISELNTTSEYEMFINTILKENTQYLPSCNLQTEMEKDITHIKECFIYNQPIKINKETFTNSAFFKKHSIKEKAPFKELDYQNLSIVDLSLYIENIHAAYNNSSSQEERVKYQLLYTKVYNYYLKKQAALLHQPMPDPEGEI